MTTTVDLLGALERALMVLRRRGWMPNGYSRLDGDEAVNLTTAVEIATDGRVGGLVSEEYQATVIALARRIVVTAQRAGLTPPLLAWSIRISDPSWFLAEQLVDHWEGDIRRSWHDVRYLLDGLIEEIGEETDFAT